MISSKIRNEIAYRCLSRVKTFSKLGEMMITKHGPLTHIDNGGSILGVAHLDTVAFGKRERKVSFKNDVVTSIQLDDRLGAWLLLDYLPTLDFMPKFDVLLTDSEEIGQSTAQYYEPYKNYNWVFSFDRAGEDVVMYQYRNKESETLLGDYGFNMGIGSFSDICSLSHLGVKCFNFGTGYHRQHTTECYANINETIAQAQLFGSFAFDNHNDLMPHSVINDYVSSYKTTYGFDDIDTVCEDCLEWLSDSWSFCPFCGREIMPAYRKLKI